MSLYTLELDQGSVDRFTNAIRIKTKANMKSALFAIRAEFIRELDRQQQRLHRSGWAAWETAYAKRRNSEFSAPRTTRFKSKLKRSGKLMQGYIAGVVVDEGNLSVTMNWPTGFYPGGQSLETVAKAHQGQIGSPKRNDIGFVPVRAFDLDRFKTIAIKRFEQAIVEGFD